MPPSSERVAVGRGLGDGVGADAAVGARTVVDDHALAEFTAHPFSQHAADIVGHAAGCERHDQLDRLVRVGLGLRLADGQAEQASAASAPKANRLVFILCFLRRTGSGRKRSYWNYIFDIRLFRLSYQR